MPEQIVRSWWSLPRNGAASCRLLHFLPSEGTKERPYRGLPVLPGGS